MIKEEFKMPDCATHYTVNCYEKKIWYRLYEDSFYSLKDCDNNFWVRCNHENWWQNKYIWRIPDEWRKKQYSLKSYSSN